MGGGGHLLSLRLDGNNGLHRHHLLYLHLLLCRSGVRSAHADLERLLNPCRVMAAGYDLGQISGAGAHKRKAAQLKPVIAAMLPRLGVVQAVVRHRLSLLMETAANNALNVEFHLPQDDRIAREAAINAVAGVHRLRRSRLHGCRRVGRPNARLHVLLKVVQRISPAAQFRAEARRATRPRRHAGNVKPFAYATIRLLIRTVRVAVLHFRFLRN